MPVVSKQHNQGIVSQTPNNNVNMKDEMSMMREPSSDEIVKVDDDKCVFKRGVCSFHIAKGEKYADVKRRSKDRGGGRGYGWVTSKLVKFRCKVVDDPGVLKSSSEKWGE